MRFVSYALVLAAMVAPPATAQTLKDAFEAAWRRSAAGAADTTRAEEAAARRDSSRGWLRESPSLAAGVLTDRIDRNAGAREYELEFAAPLALPGERRANIAVGEAEAQTLDAQRSASRLNLARDVREAYWAARLARLERELAERRLEEAAQLAQDLSRRLKAGEAARVDANQARGVQLAADATARSAQIEERRALAAFAALTGTTALPVSGESAAAESAPTEMLERPLLAVARSRQAAARARADQAARVRGDTPEFTVTLARERGEFTEVFGNTIRFGVKLPLGTDARNRVRIAQSGAERTEADAALVLETERVRTEQQLARDELAAARDAQTAAAERARLALDTQQLIGRAFLLGERDLSARLRADTERHEAELAAARAQAELGRAISRLNQSFGLLP
jgi:cobalt-zinc-cadmium efflux system outer membrane protein